MMVEKARLLGSSGKGLGQQTGGSAATDSVEAHRIMVMICPLLDKNRDLISHHLHHKQLQFLDDMAIRAAFGPRLMGITGKQLFLLRDLKDKLVEAGVL